MNIMTHTRPTAGSVTRAMLDSQWRQAEAIELNLEVIDRIENQQKQ